MATCKLNDVNPVAYIAETLTAILDGHPHSAIEDLMPLEIPKGVKPKPIGDRRSAYHQVALSKRQNAWEVIKAWRPAGATATANEKHADALEAAERISLLSQRMRQVLDALAEGQLSKELAEPLGLSVRTVELHRARMLDRLGVRTTAEAVRLLTLARLVMPS